MKHSNGQRGAIIVEATLALPFFMFAIYTLLSVIQMSYAQARMSVALDSATKQVAEYTHIYFALGLDQKFTGQGGASSALANDVASFLEELGEGVGTVNGELGAYVQGAGAAMAGDNLVALIQDGVGSGIVSQIMDSNLADGTSDSAENFKKRNHIENVDLTGSKFLEAGAGSTGRDIFMRVDYDIRVVKLLNIDFSFHLSHCAYAQAWAGGGQTNG